MPKGLSPIGDPRTWQDDNNINLPKDKINICNSLRSGVEGTSHLLSQLSWCVFVLSYVCDMWQMFSRWLLNMWKIGREREEKHWSFLLVSYDGIIKRCPECPLHESQYFVLVSCPYINTFRLEKYADVSENNIMNAVFSLDVSLLLWDISSCSILLLTWQFMSP